MSRFKIVIDPVPCTGCLRCQLACSELHDKVFNPAAARIRVDASGPINLVYFEDNCDHCGVCADHCFYGVLEKTREEAA
ncbi:MAG: 4Fe-4S binding protein [Pseudomonadota bacterium]